MNYRLFLKYGAAAILSLSLFACQNSGSSVVDALGPIAAGTYTSECFHNKQASINIGSDIYSTAIMIFAENGTGTNQYALFTDSACATPAIASGTVALSMRYVKSFGEVFVALMTQTEEGGGTQSFYLTGVVDGDDMILDLDYTKNTNCGPFDNIPVEADVLFFSVDPVARGVLLSAT